MGSCNAIAKHRNIHIRHVLTLADGIHSYLVQVVNSICQSHFITHAGSADVILSSILLRHRLASQLNIYRLFRQYFRISSFITCFPLIIMINCCLFNLRQNGSTIQALQSNYTVYMHGKPTSCRFCDATNNRRLGRWKDAPVINRSIGNWQCQPVVTSKCLLRKAGQRRYEDKPLWAVFLLATVISIWSKYAHQLIEGEWRIHASVNNAFIGADYLNQLWHNVNWTLRNKHPWNAKRNATMFIQENALENIVFRNGGHIVSASMC